MTVPDQYPQLPDGVAPRVRGIAGEFAAIRHNVEEADRRAPPVIPTSSPPETQTALAPNAGWVNFGSSYQQLGYQQLGTRVFLRGLISNTTAITNGGPSLMFTMPAGVRPALLEVFPVMGGGGTNALYRVDVQPDGTVVLYGNLAVNGYVSVSGITYSTLL